MVKKVGVDTDITIVDELQFELVTTNADDCLITPYKITKVVIYFVDRDFVSNETYSEFTQEFNNPELESKLAEAKATACASPTEENIIAVQKVKQQMEDSRVISKFFYKEARPIVIFGNDSTPAWLNPTMVPAPEKDQVEQDNILKVATDEDGAEITGTFLLDWNPVGQREGDYFICWTWTPLIAGDSISAHKMFQIGGATQLTTVLPTHMTPSNKYETLQDRYLPRMFKSLIGEGDLTPYVIRGLNNAVAKGFTFVEDMANAVIDLLDSNATHESILPLLGNMFNVRLKSNDPTLWRRQIKQSIPNYKQKGTHKGLENAFSEAGMSLKKFTRLWQVMSKYTFQEHFNVTNDDNLSFDLSHLAILPVNPNNFELYYRGVEDSEWTELSGPTDYVDLQNNDGITTMTWVGDQLSVGGILLSEGDSIRVVYQIEEVPNSAEQTLEEYIRTLSLSDQRDERDQDYPPKNWNVRLIEEDDVLFDVIIPVRHPFSHPIVWGHIRTEFPYSENVYNMEEYNGSTRPSTNPCHIDRDWLDECEQCQSSKYNIDIEIEELSNDRIIEAKQVLEEFTPFHSILHMINFSGSITEFVKSPLEEITALVQMNGEEIMITGAQSIFNRSTPHNTALSILKRDLLSNMSLVSSGNATASNQSIVIYSPGTSTTSDLQTLDGNFARFSDYSIDITTTNNATPTDNSNLLEILSPGPNAGQYTVTEVDGYMATLSATAQSPAIAEPINAGQFTFRLSNKRLEETVDITQADKFVFKDEDVNFSTTGLKSQWDVDHSNYSGNVWKIGISSSGYTAYDILNILPDGSLIIEDDGTLPTSNQTNLTWELLDENEETVTSGSDGILTVTRMGLVDFDPGFTSTIEDIRNFINIGDYVLWNTTQYRICGFADEETHKLYIEDYTSGNNAGETVLVYRRLVENVVGQLGYVGLQIDEVPTIDNTVEGDQFKENYLFLIDSNYYSINDIDGGNSILNGPAQSWTTSGTSVNYSLYQFEKDTLSIPERTEPPLPGHDFDYNDDPPKGLGGHVDRSGSEVIDLNIDNATPMAFYVSMLNQAKSGNEIIDVVKQEESISYTIEYANGDIQKGEI